MITDNQLRAIYKLRPADGLSYEDYTDITGWVERAGPDCDTSLLHEKTRERITAIFNRYFV